MPIQRPPQGCYVHTPQRPIGTPIWKPFLCIPTLQKVIDSVNVTCFEKSEKNVAYRVGFVNTKACAEKSNGQPLRGYIGVHSRAQSMISKEKRPAKNLLTSRNYWCLERESNSHGAWPQGILSPLRLPVPPSRPRLYLTFLGRPCQGRVSPHSSEGEASLRYWAASSGGVGLM